LKQAIERCKEVIKFGSQFFNENKTAAMTVWKVFCFGNPIFIVFLFFFILFPPLFLHQAALEFEQSIDKIEIISIDLPQTLLVTIEMHGKGVFNCILIVFL
jgi:hypothetical protein